MNTKDILFIVLSVSVTAFTFVMVWFLIELIRIVRGISKTIATIEGHLQRVEEVIQLVQNKIHEITAATLGLTNVIGGIANFVQKRRKRKPAKGDQ